MNSVVFGTPRESYQVANIIYAGNVGEIPVDKRKNGCSHSFKIITTHGSAFCYYKSEEAARNARGALGAMLNAVKPAAFRHGYEVLDPRRIVSYTGVISLKTPVDELTHAVVVTIDTAEERNKKVWLKYRSEEVAQKGRSALYACIHAANRCEPVMSHTAAPIVEQALAA